MTLEKKDASKLSDHASVDFAAILETQPTAQKRDDRRTREIGSRVYLRAKIFYILAENLQLRTLTRDRHPPLMWIFEFGLHRALTGFVFQV